MGSLASLELPKLVHLESRIGLIMLKRSIPLAEKMSVLVITPHLLKWNFGYVNFFFFHLISLYELNRNMHYEANPSVI